MDAFLRLKNKPNVIGAASDFTYHWGITSGLDHQHAARLAVAVSELVTDVVLFAFGEREGEMELTFQRHEDNVEVIVHERGEPFNPDRHRYDVRRAIEEGDFDGAGFELVRILTDDFIYLNLGRQGKEFRLVQRVKVPHIADLLTREELSEKNNGNNGSPSRYEVRVIEEEDAEDISKLIYRTYRHTYHKESLYFPRKIELAIQQKEKFGVIARTADGEPAGYFAIVMSTDSKIGEVGEAVVAVPHRRRGLMTRMLKTLVKAARERGLQGVFGEANAAHAISQRTNAKFGFESTAILLAVSPAMKLEGFGEETGVQAVSSVLEFLPLVTAKPRVIFPPAHYADLVLRIYKALKIEAREGKPREPDYAEKSDIEVVIDYEDRFALLVVRSFGEDFRIALAQTVHEMEHVEVDTVEVDLPIENPATARVAGPLRELGFIFSGLMPMFHQEKDYLRFQLIRRGFDFELVHTFSALGKELKAIIQKEYYEVQADRRPPGSESGG